MTLIHSLCSRYATLCITNESEVLALLHVVQPAKRVDAATTALVASQCARELAILAEHIQASPCCN
jgi:hypothetical protein